MEESKLRKAISHIESQSNHETILKVLSYKPIKNSFVEFIVEKTAVKNGRVKNTETFKEILDIDHLLKA
jgi:hypothetical protein